MRWWGWGEAGHPATLGATALDYLRERVGLREPPLPPVALERVRLPATRLPAGTLDRLRAILGADGLSTEHHDRVVHSAGKGYPDLVRIRAGAPEGAPDAILFPRSHEQIVALLELASRDSLAVVPFGGGTSVVGGVAPLGGPHRAVLALDTSRMASVLGLDGQSRIVTVQGGIRAVALERHLASRGLTLGHYPQSFEYVSLGGCAATRSAGQASTGYGAIAKMVLGLRLASPAREISLPPVPSSAAGPDLRQLLVGSEGVLGVISDVSLRVRAAPRQRIYEGMFFCSFAEGVAAIRELAHEHSLPDVVRLSDESETRMSLLLSGGGTLKGALTRAYLGVRGVAQGCVAILGFEGSPREVVPRRERALVLLRAGGGVGVGRSPGRSWLRGRYEAPYLRDELLTHGVMVETLETATSWSGLTALHRSVTAAISAALARQGTPGLVMCHVSHVYETGASLYFTFIARQREGEEIAQWHAVKEAASQAIVTAGATITHHHAIGRDHSRWLGEEIGEGGLGALRALKAELDPAGVMNPGKLL
jgi:alkyldihydroxyacetonephosphate synthase